MSLSVERIATIIQRELAYIVNNEIKDSQVGYINLTDVKVTKDLSYANIYYTVLSDDKDVLDRAKNILAENKATIRMELAKKIKDIRKIPELVFKYDEALAYGNHINKVLQENK